METPLAGSGLDLERDKDPGRDIEAMSGFLLNTNVISEFVLPDNNLISGVKQWLEAANPDSPYASVLTFGEIRKGIERLAPGKRRAHLEPWLARDLHEWFEDRLRSLMR